MRAILLASIIFILPQISNAEDIDKKYQQILFNYANAALMEFYYVNSWKSPREFNIKDAHFIKGTDKINRTFYVVLFPEDDHSIYVSLELTKDGLLGVHGRGGVNVSPEELRLDFKNQIRKMVHYPGAT